MPKVKMRIDYDYIRGHLRYGHSEGIIDLTEEELRMLQENPKKTINELDLDCDLELKIDDYSIEEYGNISNIQFEVIN